MLPKEVNPDRFIIPDNVRIDETSALVYEKNQVDRVILNSLNVRGDSPSNGTLMLADFVGMSMSQDVFISKNGPFSGIFYEQIEVVIFNLGDGVDSIIVENTSEAIHVMNLGGENDTVTVKDISGPLIINGGEGIDLVLVSSDDSKLDQIGALLIVDGGDDEDDTLTLDNSNDEDVDDVVNVTRLIVQVESMMVPDRNMTAEEENNPILPRDSYLITLRNATGGSFTLSVDDPMTGRSSLTTPPISYPTTATVIEGAVNELLIPLSLGNETGRAKSCGVQNSSICSTAVEVWQLGDSDTYAIFFVGQRLNQNVTLSLDTSQVCTLCFFYFVSLVIQC